MYMVKIIIFYVYLVHVESLDFCMCLLLYVLIPLNENPGFAIGFKTDYVDKLTQEKLDME